MDRLEDHDERSPNEDDEEMGFGETRQVDDHSSLIFADKKEQLEFTEIKKKELHIKRKIKQEEIER